MLYLPAELVSRIILGALQLDADLTGAAVRTLSRLLRTCKRLRECALPLWMDVTLSLIPESGAPAKDGWPASWRDVAARALRVEHPLLLPDAPLPRRSFGHSSVVWRDTLYLFGGRHDQTHYGSLDTLNLPTRKWRANVATEGMQPTARRLHTAVVDGRAGIMYMVGGGRTGEQMGPGDMHELDLASLTWSRGPSPPNFDCMSHTCVLACRGPSPAGCLLVFGGVTLHEQTFWIGANGPAPTDDPLAATEAHSTVTDTHLNWTDSPRDTHPLPPTPAHSYPLPPTLTHSHPPTHPLLSTSTHSQATPCTSELPPSQPPPLWRSSCRSPPRGCCSSTWPHAVGRSSNRREARRRAGTATPPACSAAR